MDRWHYAYAGLRVTSELPIPEWAAFEPPGSFADPDVVIALGGVPNPADGSSLREAQPATQQSPDWDDGIPSRNPPAATAPITRDEFHLHIPETGDYYVHHGREILVTPAPNAGAREVRLFLLGSAWGALCYQRGILALHSSVVQVGDGAVAFCGPTGSGKSSVAARLVARGFPLVADDLCRFDPSGEHARVYPASPRLKLWRDALDWMGWSADGLERDHFRLDKFHLLSGVSGATFQAADNSSALPLRAIYLLEWGEIGLTRLTGVTALRLLVESGTYRGELLEPMGRLGEHWERCADLARRVPIFQFVRPNDRSSPDHATEALVGHIQRPLTISRNDVILSPCEGLMTNTSPVQPTTVFRRKVELPFSQLDDELLAVDAQAGYCYSLSETAGRVWDLIATPMSLAAICAQLGREYAVDEQTCQRQVVALLQSLREAGLAEAGDALSP